MGIVEKMESRIVYTIEGNNVNTCKKKDYPNSGSIICRDGISVY